MTEWLYGRNAIYETLRAGRRKVTRLWVFEGAQIKGRLEEILVLARQNHIPVEKVKRGGLDRINPGHQGVAAEVSAYGYADLAEIFIRAAKQREKLFVLMLDLLQDVHNVGSLLRTAEGVGVHGVILPLREAAGITPAVVNASAGASEHLLIARHNLAQAIETLKKQDVWVVGLEDDPEAVLPHEVRLDGALALVVGGEGSGMRPLVRQSCDVLMRLPMRGNLNSYNAAVAGSIALFLAAQARG
ncbi:MAG: 23S rRNA (guanosine(2251)-2'-O)-methyltransferase RlmB [Chloroflexota bacterium]